MRPNTLHSRWRPLRWLGTAMASALVACAGTGTSVPDREALNASHWAKANRLPQAPSGGGWRHQVIGTRPASMYTPVRHEGRPALKAESERGDSLLHLPLAVDGRALGTLRFSWFVNALNPLSDLTDGQHDDAVARIILQFGGDRSTFSGRDRMISDMLQALTGEPLPFATLIYVWDHRYPVGTIIPHRRTPRIKTMVIESGSARLAQWVDIERDIAADFQAAFGHAPERLKGLALMTDSNNTKHPTRAWYGPLRWQAAPAS